MRERHSRVLGRGVEPKLRQGIGVMAARTVDDPLDEALRLIELTEKAGVVIRLLGGVAVRARVPTLSPNVRPPGRDFDLVTSLRFRAGLEEILADGGYLADRQFNAVNGRKQLYFIDLERDRPVDIICDEFDMCHRLALTERLGVDRPTLPLADLLLTKLQVVRITRKDLADAGALLGEYPLAADDSGISLARIVSVTSGDWGWWRTVSGSLATLRAFASEELADGGKVIGREWRFEPVAQVDALKKAIDEAPKSLPWRARARIGERVTWYSEPEEIQHD